MIEPPPSATSLAALRLQFFGFIFGHYIRGDLHDYWRPSSKTPAHLSTAAGIQKFCHWTVVSGFPVLLLTGLLMVPLDGDFFLLAFHS
jgi:hypothetical protein